MIVSLVQDNGDGEGPYNATASWGTEGAADSFTTFMDSKTYMSKLSADQTEVFYFCTTVDGEMSSVTV